MHELGGLRDRLDHAGLVVGEHERDQRPRTPARASALKPPLERRQIDDPSSVTGSSSTCSRSKAPARQHRRMLDRRDQQPVARRPAGSPTAMASAPAYWPRSPPEVKVTQRGSPPTRAATLSRASSIDWRAARPSACTEEGLPASVERGQHRRPRLRAQRRRRIPVEIDPRHHQCRLVAAARRYLTVYGFHNTCFSTLDRAKNTPLQRAPIRGAIARAFRNCNGSK